jgi:hypothetical protein
MIQNGRLWLCRISDEVRINFRSSGGSVVGRSVVIGLPVVGIYLAVVLGSREVISVLSFSLFMILRFGSFE